MSAAPRASALRVVARTLGVCRREPLALLGLALFGAALPTAAMFVLGAAFAAGWLPWEEEAGSDLAIGLLSLAIWGLSTLLQVVAATSGTLRVARGERFALAAALGTAVRRAPAVLVAGAITAAAVLSGLAFLVVPGAAAFAGLCAAVPAATDGAGPFGAIGRSLDLTRGDRPALFFGVGGTAAAATAAAWAPVLSLGGDPHPALVLAAVGWLALLAPLPAVAAAVAYAELRDRKDGRTDLVKVFE